MTPELVLSMLDRMLSHSLPALHRDRLLKIRKFVESVDKFGKALADEGEMPACRAWALIELNNFLEGKYAN